MPNIIDPMVTALADSGKQAKMSASVEFDVDEHGSGRAPVVSYLTEGMGYNQMLDFQVDVGAAETDYNLWEAPAGVKARAVMIRCILGGGAIALNSGNTPTGFPLVADNTAGNGWLMYSNPSETEITVGGTPTGNGIQDIKVSTENESRFHVLIFV